MALHTRAVDARFQNRRSGNKHSLVMLNLESVHCVSLLIFGNHRHCRVIIETLKPQFCHALSKSWDVNKANITAFTTVGPN